MIRPDERYQLFINGQWVKSNAGNTFKAYNPANNEILSTCVDASKEDVDMAVTAAWQAYETWKDISPRSRARMLLKIADLIDENAERLAFVETLDNGKPIRETLHIDVPLSSDHFRYFASAVRTEEGQAVQINKDTLSLVLREPLGVIGQIIPWNFPLLMAAWKIAPALAAGNTIVIKPSSSTSLSLLELAKLMAEVLPPGVVNVITGKGSASGNYLLEHNRLSKLAFTGSTEVGYTVSAAAAKKLIPATLELGGKSANIFFPDAPWDKAMEGLLMGILYNQGQVCSAGSRAFVHEEIYDRFVAEAVAAFARIKVGLPWEKDTQMGSLINPGQLKKVLEYVDIGKAEGAKIAYGGEKLTEAGLANGSFMKPTILTEVNNAMRVAQEEIFGPVVCIIKFKDEAEVIRLANDSEYGLGGAVWTKDINRAFRVARAVQTGRMWVNNYNSLPAHAPFGGYKKSGLGRETHKMMLEHYSQTKNIFISLTESKIGLY
ncbi:aldehyde dehydrogenase family protein|uniref:Acyl-CoA reductase n=1 Tax=Dendrosporobacter quercicolus TaxID=146817 RepID=A0A1G9SW49_9FIRM|nr:aldehyde dehydrogenase family protein [Dendrosporobacter quercicolus]NSL48599.1 aldehyde dehydrogenase family protein [Dendrosporobacter quercicolus DSM 1736]SDM39577.1 Acyl-CoA reductase [Dendrosporobacter quercicolus]